MVAYKFVISPSFEFSLVRGDALEIATSHWEERDAAGVLVDSQDQYGWLLGIEWGSPTARAIESMILDRAVQEKACDRSGVCGRRGTLYTLSGAWTPGKGFYPRSKFFIGRVFGPGYEKEVVEFVDPAGVHHILLQRSVW